MKLFTIFGLALIIVFTSIAFAGDIKVINAKSGFPEGPLWHKDKLFYVEYGSQTVMTWDGKQNQEFGRMVGCGPSAIVALPVGDFLDNEPGNPGLSGGSSRAPDQAPPLLPAART